MVMEGGLLDSRLLHVRFLFDELSTGWAFVRSASALADTDVQDRTVTFAQDTHDAIVRLADDARLTVAERQRLDEGLESLQAAIDDFSPAPGLDHHQ